MGTLIKLPSTDQRLVKNCRKGDGKAQRELYEKYAPQMLSVCRRYVRSLEDAEEVLSNAFITSATKKTCLWKLSMKTTAS